MSKLVDDTTLGFVAELAKWWYRIKRAVLRTESMSGGGDVLVKMSPDGITLSGRGKTKIARPQPQLWVKLTTVTGDAGDNYAADVYRFRYSGSSLASSVIVRNAWEEMTNAAYANANITSVLRLPEDSWHPVESIELDGADLVYVINERPEPTCSGSAGALDGGSP